MNIALIGYGKMGKTIERIAIERGHSIVAKLTSQHTSEDWERVADADIAIEFTRPDAALENFKKCLEKQVPIVTGTTGWYEHKHQVSQTVKAVNGAFFWASNFSIGVNLFWQINKQLAKLMNGHPEYTPSMIEIHHTQKLDEPSGTAITTAEQIIDGLDKYSTWKLQSDNPDTEDIKIESIREGDVKGTHSVRYDSPIDYIELTHSAKTRDGFALGSILAAEFLIGKKGFFTMSDLLAL